MAEIKVYTGNKDIRKSEYSALKYIIDSLKNIASEETFYLLSNYYCNGKQIDFTLLCKKGAMILEYKNYQGKIIGSENGDWFAVNDGNQTQINDSGYAPFQQIRSHRFALSDFIKDNKNEIFVDQKSSQIDPTHVQGVLFFEGPIEFDESQIDPKTRCWLSVIDKNESFEMLLNSMTGNLTFEENEITKLIELLKLQPMEETMIENQSVEVCIACLYNEEKCQIPYLNGKIAEIKDNEITIETGNSIFKTVTFDESHSENIRILKTIFQFYKAELQGIFVPEIAFVHLFQRGNTYYASKDTLVLIEPDWLVNVRDMADIDFCHRNYLVNKYESKSTNKSMFRGITVGATLKNIVQEPEDIDQSLQAARNHATNNPVICSNLNVTEDDVIAEAKPHIGNLHTWAKQSNLTGEPVTETFMMIPQLGLKGRIDLTFQENDEIINVIELKSSESWGGTIKYGDELQVVAYGMMVIYLQKKKLMDAPKVVYSGNPNYLIMQKDSSIKRISTAQKEAAFNNEMFRKVIDTRNYLIQGEITGTMEFENVKQNKCIKCKSIDTCYTLCSLFKTRSCNSSCDRHPDNSVSIMPKCTIYNKYSDLDKENFKRLNRHLDIERIALNKKLQESWSKETSQKIEEGYCIEIQNYKVISEEDIFKLKIECSNNSELREGDFVIISDLNGPLSGKSAMGNIYTISKSELIIDLDEELNFTPQYVEKYTSDNLFLNQYKGLFNLFTKNKNSYLKNILFENVPSDIEKETLSFLKNSTDYYLIQGPPGSGKTTKIVNLTKELSNNGKKILIATSTNQAADIIVQKLKDIDWGSNILRIGYKYSIKESSKDRTIEHILSNVEENEKISYTKNLLDTTKIFISTASSWIKGDYRFLAPFDYVIIDEAGQISIPETLGIISLGNNIVLVGDHQQLSSIFYSDDIYENGNPLSKSLFEVMWNWLSEKHILSRTEFLPEQYRMNKEICFAPSNIWYASKLKPATEAVANQRIELNHKLNGNTPLEIAINPDYPSVWVSQSGSGSNRQNIDEANICTALVKEFINYGIKPEEIGVVAPFRNQVALIKRKVEELCSSNGILENLKIDTADRFQGDERDVVIISLTACSSNKHPFLSDDRRINVALTRARKKRIIVGDANFFKKEDVFNKMAEDCSTKIIKL